MEDKKGDSEIFKEDWSWQRLVDPKNIPLILGVAGLVLVVIGLLSFSQKREPEIQILPVEQVDSGTMLVVNLSGAVEKPGVYQLPGGSRLNDLLVRAGGLSDQADREWIDKNLNLAQKLTDGVKVYIPMRGEASVSQGSGGQVAGAGVQGKVNINTASTSQLDTLWGIGAKRAADIIKNRPYSSVEELITKKIIPQSVFEKIKEELTVY